MLCWPSYTFAFRSVFCPQAAKKHFFMSGNEFERQQVTLIVAIVETPRLNVRKQLVREMFLLRSVVNLFPKIKDPFVMMPFLSLPEFRVSISLSLSHFSTCSFLFLFLLFLLICFSLSRFPPLSFHQTAFAEFAAAAPAGSMQQLFTILQRDSVALFRSEYFRQLCLKRSPRMFR